MIAKTTMRVLSLSLLLVGWPITSTAQMTEAEGIEFFEAKIRPVLVRECYGCHSAKADQSRGGLQLDTKQSMLLGGDTGPSVVPGNLEDSLIWSAINYEDFEMPPEHQLPADTIEDFRVWIEAGAPDPRTPVRNVSIRSTITKEDIRQGRREFWAFQHPLRTEISLETVSDWAKGPIDQFIDEKRDERGLQPAPDAEPQVLLRRLCFDLIGLPPTPEQLDWFMDRWEADPDQAIADTVDHLLDSPRFGERWGRHWLDVARYAESSGKELNATFPHAWRYRDYVIDSFNQDKPYDEFIQEQIAGDLLPVKSDEEWTEHLIATGFLAMGPKTLTEQNPRQFRADLIDEQIDVTTRVVLGMSVACARCHDHKFDPIPQTDYYAMVGIFGNMDTYYGTLDNLQNRRPSNLILLPIDDVPSFQEPLTDEELESLRARRDEIRERYREALVARQEARRQPDSGSGENSRRLVRQIRQLSTQLTAVQSVLDAYEENGAPKSFCMGVQAIENPQDANLLIRGEVDQLGEKVPRGFVQVVGGNPRKIRKDSSGRLELARWITDESNPLIARVMANRIWMHLMGSGIVETTENFGATGMPPTHPKLLDYLAVRFMEQDWSIKSLIREMATSRTYRMSSRYDSGAYELDPDNRWLWRASPRRLEAEAIRDAMLSISGKLRRDRPEASEVARAGTTITRNGQLRNIRETAAQILEGDRMDPREMRRRRLRDQMSQSSVQHSSDPDAYYRSVYLPVVRDNVPRSLAVFDFAESSMVVGQREVSNTPDQGLFFLNNEMVYELSHAFAERLMEWSDERTAQVERAFLLAWGRTPTSVELNAALEFLKEFESNLEGRHAELQKLTFFCQSVMAAAEFRIVN